jgi:hypothetical protein
MSMLMSELERLGDAIALRREPALKRDRRLREVPPQIVFAVSHVPPPRRLSQFHQIAPE